LLGTLLINSYVAALHAKVPLTIYDPSPKVLSSALTKLESLLSRDVSKNRISQADSDQARERVKGVNGDGTSGEVIEGVDLVIEVRLLFAARIHSTDV
jgi:3-hydroxybutyryl-CoA dehydrogenase